MAKLPHGNVDLYRELKDCFSQTPMKFSDFNKIFFDYKCPFFSIIEKYYSKEGDEFLNIYKYLQKLVKDIEIIFPQKELPILKTKDKNKSLELTRKQVALLFLLSFFNFIEESKNNRFYVYNILYSKYGAKFEFGRCFLNYLTIIGKWLEQENKKEEIKKILEEKIIYKRDNIDSQDYLNKNIDLCEIKLDKEKSLFDGDDQYFIDFANKYIGGGALTGGCVQEEILFAVQPEAIVSMFFMEVMDKDDAIGIYNTIKYSNYTGYGNKFRFENSSITNDLTQIKKYKIIAIDAVDNRHFYNNYYYFSNNNQKDIIRDIHKAYVGFNLINSETEKNIEKTIATGNWGCGAFGGNHELKFIQQWIAASFAGVQKLDYFTFNRKEMEIACKYHNEIQDKYKTANSLYEAITLHPLDENNIIKNLLK